MTDDQDGGMYGHGAYTTDEGTAMGRFTMYGKTTADIQTLIDRARASSLTEMVSVAEHDYNTNPGQTGVSTPGNATKDVFVEFQSENSIDHSFVSRGFIYDGPVHIHGGREYWTVITHKERDLIDNDLASIQSEMNAEINVQQISPYQHARDPISEREVLSARQQEVLKLARSNGYYSYPRETTSRELASKLDISKTTFLEHLRKAEAKLLGPGTDE
ncbi:helix-turn-helix domain-containing protein [Salinadaptatus halalkaliphilus]|uniref:helix-turn-helix domain-containing protein n=1 Tax=Salinadaptatus halalkaliphilus TaxID=2419781 RepID=UPI001C2CC365|nr:helix-turn-helix domain-containing protein [Salinadaptatus halalkaliphilus]